MNLYLITRITLAVLILFLSQSCQTIKDYQKQRSAIGLENDNKFIKIVAPSGYCLYSDEVPLEREVYAVDRIANALNKDSGIMFQECEEKNSFLLGVNPKYRTVGEVRFFTGEMLQLFKQFKADRSRESFAYVINKLNSQDTVESLNLYVRDVMNPAIKKHDNIHIIDQSTLLNQKQKNELKLVHAEIFGNEQHAFLYYSAKLLPGFANIDLQKFRVGKITVKCAAAQTLINYIPVSLSLCEEGSDDDWISLETKVISYTKDLMKLNGDE